MISSSRLAWLQLRRQKVRLLVAIAGVAFAVVLMLMQLGFMDALFRSAVNIHLCLAADLVMIDPRYNVIVRPTQFPDRRLQQARAFPDVESVAPMHLGVGQWKNPEDASTREIFVIGVDPTRQVFTPAALADLSRSVRYPDVMFFDEASRPEFGPIAATLHSGQTVTTELNRRQIDVEGLFTLGTSFGIDATLITSDLNFRRAFPSYPAGAVSVGLIRLRPGADAAQTRDALNAYLPPDVRVMTIGEFVTQEIAYWAVKTPIGFVFTFGVIMGVVVGMIIVYQILFTDVAEHLKEYATLKAMGRTNLYLSGVVVVEATVLALSGFLPALGIAWWLYALTQSATRLPMAIRVDRALLVLGLTMLMCWLSGLIAMRKLRTADPAEVF